MEEKMRRTFVLAIAVGVIVMQAATLRAQGDKKEPALHVPDALKWRDGPKSLPPGAKIAILEGDASKSGPFVFRLKVPDGYKIPPHMHSNAERVTIISGKFFLGMGEKFSANHATELPTGTFGMWPAGMKHFVWVEGETVVQFHGEGPWTIVYHNLDDDPRRK